MSLACSSRSARRVRLLRESTMRRASSFMRSFPASAFSSSQSTSYHASGGSFASARAASIFSIRVACAVSSTAQAWLLGSSFLAISALWQGVVAFATILWQHIVAFATICYANLQGENHAEASRTRRAAPEARRHHPAGARRGPAGKVLARLAPARRAAPAARRGGHACAQGAPGQGRRDRRLLREPQLPKFSYRRAPPGAPRLRERRRLPRRQARLDGCRVSRGPRRGAGRVVRFLALPSHGVKRNFCSRRWSRRARGDNPLRGTPRYAPCAPPRRAPARSPHPHTSPG